jgi:hypothetical protein
VCVCGADESTATIVTMIIKNNNHHEEQADIVYCATAALAVCEEYVNM